MTNVSSTDDVRISQIVTDLLTDNLVGYMF